MKSPKSKKEILEKFGEIWETEVPEWRFGQLICNLKRRYDDTLFYLDDDELLEKMTIFFEELKDFRKRHSKGEER